MDVLGIEMDLSWCEVGEGIMLTRSYFLATFSCEFLLLEDDKDEQSPSLMYLSYRKGRKYILEMYNPHRFAWYHGFRQGLLGTHVLPSYYIDSSSLYHASLSLIRQGSGATFHVPKVNNSISSDIDPSYIAWWDKKNVSSIHQYPYKSPFSK
jgi:hypothetical protein